MDNTEALATIASISTQTIKYIRRGETANVGETLTFFIEHFSTFMEEYQLKKNTNIINMLAVMLKAQEKNDMLFVADILQYELIPYVKKLVAK